MKKFIRIFIPVILLLIVAFIYYYITLPAINIHSPGFWMFLISLLVILCVVAGLMTANLDRKGNRKPGPMFLVLCSKS